MFSSIATFLFTNVTETGNIGFIQIHTTVKRENDKGFNTSLNLTGNLILHHSDKKKETSPKKRNMNAAFTDIS